MGSKGFHRLAHEDHEGNVSHTRYMGSWKTIGALVISLVSVLLDAFKGTATILPASMLVGVLLGSKSVETLASQKRAKEEFLKKAELGLVSKKEVPIESAQGKAKSHKGKGRK